MRVTINYHTRGNLLNALAKRDKVLEQKIRSGFRSMSEWLLNQALLIVPRDTGYLAETGRIKESKSPRMGVSFTVEFGGYDFPGEWRFSPKENRMVFRKPWKYALAVHEIPAKHDSPEQHEYLAKPARNLIGLRTAFRAGFSGTKYADSGPESSGE